jgi:hypothetical protein
VKNDVGFNGQVDNRGIKRRAITIRHGKQVRRQAERRLEMAGFKPGRFRLFQMFLPGEI